MVGPLAVYTVIHPGVRDFVAEWYRSVAEQTDLNFDLWISLDSLETAEAASWIGQEVPTEWLQAPPGASPVTIRSQAIERLIKKYEAIIFVDSDDVLHPSRVEAAREAVASNDLVACALRLVDRQGAQLGSTFSLPARMTIDDVLPRYNLFGLSNSAYRSELLRRCLPFPGGMLLVDWFLATRAWLMGARMAFDPVVRMDYRQYGSNTARVVYPITAEQVEQDTQLVRRHFEFVTAPNSPDAIPERHQRLQNAAAEVETFYQRVVRKPGRLEQYAERLNILKPPLLWWSSVANPALESMWQTKRTNQT